MFAKFVRQLLPGKILLTFQTRKIRRAMYFVASSLLLFALVASLKGTNRNTNRNTHKNMIKNTNRTSDEKVIKLRLIPGQVRHTNRNMNRNMIKNTNGTSGEMVIKLRLVPGQVCVRPHLELNHSSIYKYFRQEPPLDCGTNENWIYVQNGTFRISKNALAEHDNISCRYQSFGCDGDFKISLKQEIYPMVDGAPLQADFFNVGCASRNNQSYNNTHSGISYNTDAHARAEKYPLPVNAMGLSILMLAFDSVSRLSWIRNLPKTHSYFTNHLGGLDLEGYNIVGDGTPPALLGILTGRTEEELPEARREHKDAAPVDNHPWIWNEFKKIGYITQWAEDQPSIGTFTYRMLGFKNKPVDHYMRPYHIEAKKLSSNFVTSCQGSVSTYRNQLNWFRDSFEMYGNKRKFMFSFFGEYSHDDNVKVQNADDDTLNFLKYLEHGGHLEHTIVVMFSDHGSRFGYIRESVQGKLEERLPYMGFRFPSWFASKYPEAIKNFQINVNRLTTPFDIHETFKEVIKYDPQKEVNLLERGISLFKEIPKERSCAQAGILSHWCACLTWHKLDQGDPNGPLAAMEIVSGINSFTEGYRKECESLDLVRIISVVKYSANDNVLKFMKSDDFDGRNPDLSDDMRYGEILYQVTIETSPGRGRFEATVRQYVDKDMFSVEENQISRINKYGNDPHCVMRTVPHLRPYCYCKRLAPKE